MAQVKCKATSVAKNGSDFSFKLSTNTRVKKKTEISPFLNLLLFCLLCKQLCLQGRQLALHLNMRIMMRGSKYPDMVCVGTKCETRRMNCKTNDGQADAAVKNLIAKQSAKPVEQSKKSRCPNRIVWNFSRLACRPSY